MGERGGADFHGQHHADAGKRGADYGRYVQQQLCKFCCRFHRRSIAAHGSSLAEGSAVQYYENCSSRCARLTLVTKLTVKVLQLCPSESSLELLNIVEKKEKRKERNKRQGKWQGTSELGKTQRTRMKRHLFKRHLFLHI